MCGRFVSARKRLELLEAFAAERDSVAEDRNPDYNVAPTKRIYTVLQHKQEADSGQAPPRELRLLRWGLVPFWAKDAKGGARMINARAETVTSKPAFRAAFAKRRCLIFPMICLRRLLHHTRSRLTSPSLQIHPMALLELLPRPTGTRIIASDR